MRVFYYIIPTDNGKNVQNHFISISISRIFSAMHYKYKCNYYVILPTLHCLSAPQNSSILLIRPFLRYLFACEKKSWLKNVMVVISTPQLDSYDTFVRGTRCLWFSRWWVGGAYGSGAYGFSAYGTRAYGTALINPASPEGLETTTIKTKCFFKRKTKLNRLSSKQSRDPKSSAGKTQSPRKNQMSSPWLPNISFPHFTRC